MNDETDLSAPSAYSGEGSRMTQAGGRSRVAVVTAGGSGMGRAICLALARTDVSVFVADIDPVGGSETVAEIQNAGGTAEFVPVNVADVDQLRALFEKVDRSHGCLDVLVNHAGVPGYAGLEVDEADWQRVVDINVKSTFYATRFAVPLMRNAGRGSIVFTSSLSALVGSTNSPLYGMTKGAVLSLMRSLVVPLAPLGIRVNAICPGAVDTPMLPQFFAQGGGSESAEQRRRKAESSSPLGRTARPDEVAEAVAFLASDASSYVNGVTLPVDGGSSRR